MPNPAPQPPTLDLICFSHLRWNFVFQRPQHLLTRCALDRRVFYVEEPLYSEEIEQPRLEMEQASGVTIVVPHVPRGSAESEAVAIQRRLLDDLLARERITQYVAWYYTPMALAFSDHLAPQALVYDCMDELSAFAHAPASLKALEAELLRRADVVFTGGQSLYEAKRDAHSNVHAFPSSVDVHHFARARGLQADPEDQAHIARPRLGFFGVIDERMDLALLAGIAAARPAWQIVMLGPVVKIDPATLPRAANIHYLGSKKYDELPHYISGWDVALLPFARNDATRFISPTKTPEYMAAGRPVVSTSIRDVVRPYGQQGLVRIADTVADFVAACEAALAEEATIRLRDADAFLRQTSCAFLRQTSWDGTWARMRRCVDAVLTARTEPARAAGVS
jgi:glycosyltransferase involved in cell wall biosynthesis